MYSVERYDEELRKLLKQIGDIPDMLEVKQHVINYLAPFIMGKYGFNLYAVWDGGLEDFIEQEEVILSIFNEEKGNV